MRRPRISPPCALALLGVLLLLVASILPRSSRAHGGRLPLAEWGAFEPGAARCQRVLSQAAAACAIEAWRARRSCRAAWLDGDACDEQAIAALIGDVRRDSLDHADAYCGERQAQELSFLGSFDLQTDLIDFCRAWERAADSAVYGPVDRLSREVSPSERTCVAETAKATTRLMLETFRLRRPPLDRMAVKPYETEAKRSLYDDASRRIERLRGFLATRLAQRCDASVFESLYAKDTARFLRDIGARADCVGGQFYIQDAFLCADSTCGNGIVEPGETCDDGNTVDGDACSADCQTAAAPATAPG